MQRGRYLLREWLDRSKLKQKDLADRLGISDAYLSQILLGNRRPKLELLTLIEHTTGVPVSSWVDTRSGELDQPTEVDAK